MGEGNGNPLQCSCLENPRDGEPGGLPSMGSHRVGHDWSNLAAAAVVTYPWSMSITDRRGGKLLPELGQNQEYTLYCLSPLQDQTETRTLPGITPLFSFLPFPSSVSWNTFLVSYLHGVCCWGTQSQRTPWTFLSCFPPLLLLLLLFFFFSSFIL